MAPQTTSFLLCGFATGQPVLFRLYGSRGAIPLRPPHRAAEHEVGIPILHVQYAAFPRGGLSHPWAIDVAPIESFRIIDVPTSSTCFTVSPFEAWRVRAVTSSEKCGLGPHPDTLDKLRDNLQRGGEADVRLPAHARNGAFQAPPSMLVVFLCMAEAD